jgi:hypothetical protein
MKMNRARAVWLVVALHVVGIVAAIVSMLA